MPRLVYTAAKGLYEDLDGGSGFSISNNSVIQKAQSIQMAAPIYKFTFKNLVATGNQGYHDVLLSIYDTAGTQYKVLLKRSTGTPVDIGDGTADNSTAGDFASGATTVTVTHNATADTIAEDVAKAFAAMDSNAAFVYTAASADASVGTTYHLNIYSLDNGTLASAKETLMTAESATEPSAGAGIQVGGNNGQNSNQAYVSEDVILAVTSRGQSGGVSAVIEAAESKCGTFIFSSVSDHEVADMLKASGGAAGAVNQYQTAFSLADPPADREGQRAMLINNNAYRYVKVTASAIAGGDTVVIEPQKVSHLIWTGSKWQRMPNESETTYS